MQKAIYWMHMDYVYNALRHLCKKEKLVQKGYKNEDCFVVFTISYLKINKHVVKTISAWQ